MNNQLSDIASRCPELLAGNTLRLTCSKLWAVWVATLGRCKHYEYGAMRRSWVDVIANDISEGFPSQTAYFQWGSVVLRRQPHEPGGQQKYTLEVADGVPLFTYSIMIITRYSFDIKFHKYYTYVFTKTDHVLGLKVRRTTSLNGLRYRAEDIIKHGGCYHLMVTTPAAIYRYRVDDRVNACMHLSNTYILTGPDLGRLTGFMATSDLDFYAALPSALLAGLKKDS